MIEVIIKWLSKSKRDPKTFRDFAQRMANRLQVGELIYGSPKRKQKYMSRLDAELQVYKEKGNTEQLINIANYAFLESIAPEHPLNYFDNTIGSATRHRFGGERREGD